MSKMTTSLTGPDAVRRWNSSYDHGHVPLWLKTKAAKYLKAKGSRWPYRDGHSILSHAMHELEAANLFDHAGSIKGEGQSPRQFLLSPYVKEAEAKKLAEKVAGELGIRFAEIICPSPYHPKAVTVIFQDC